MGYVDGFLAAVPAERKQEFIDHAKLANGVFIDLGATRVIECWGDDVPAGTVTDFRRAVKAEDDEIVVFSWVEWPDKDTRDTAIHQLADIAESDPRMNPETNPMPFDGKRLIYGGFVPVVKLTNP